MSELGAGGAKPGTIPLRPLRVGEILEGAVATMRKHPALLLGAAFVVVAVTELIALAVTRGVRAGSPAVRLTDPNITRQEALDLLADLAPVWGITLGIGLLAQTFLSGLVTVVVGKSVLGKPLPGREAWNDVRPRLLPLLGLTVLFTLIVIAGPVAGAALTVLLGGSGGAVLFIAGTVLAVWLYVRLSLATPALVLEPAGVVAALRRSAMLVRGAWGRTFGILLVALLAAFVISLLVQIPFSVAAGTDPSQPIGLGSALVTTLGATVAGTISYPFTAGVTALVYIDRRMRRENMQDALASAARADDG